MNCYQQTQPLVLQVLKEPIIYTAYILGVTDSSAPVTMTPPIYLLPTSFSAFQPMILLELLVYLLMCLFYILS